MSSMLCGILLVLHVNIISAKCHIMVMDSSSLICRQQSEEERHVLDPPSKLFISADPCFVMPMWYCIVIETSNVNLL